MEAIEMIDPAAEETLIEQEAAGLVPLARRRDDHRALADARLLDAN